MFILGDVHDKGYDWLHYEWLEDYTKNEDDVSKLNELFSDYNWRFKIGGLKHWGGSQCTGATLKHLVTKQVKGA